MKKHHQKTGILLKCCLWICFPILLLSCNDYYFSVPQPIDKTDEDEFPKMFRGKWKADSNFVFEAEFDETIEIKGPNKSESKLAGPTEERLRYRTFNIFKNQPVQEEAFVIGKRYLYFILVNPYEIYNGIWPDKPWQNEPEIFNSLRSLRYDSVKKRYDTVDNYIIRKNLIYEIQDDGGLGRGFLFTTQKDLISINRIDTILVELGSQSKLRKLKKNIYVLSIQSHALREGNTWWRIFLLEYRDKSIFYHEINHKSGKLPCMFYAAPSKYDQFYFDCEWSAPEMIRLMEEGYFSISDRLIKE